MSVVERLPKLLEQVDVPRHVSPSALASWGECPLKLTASSRGVASDRLPAGPDAAVGTLVHRVREQWTRGDGPEDPEALFDSEYEKVRAALRLEPRRSHFAELAATRPAEQWARLRARTIEQCRHQGRGSRPAQASTGGRTGIGSGAEKLLVSDSLRLRGRADRVQRFPGRRFEVRDYKTGNVVADNGEIVPEVRLQLSAYALMILEAEPRAEVSLVVDDGELHELPFDRATRERARAEIESIIGSLPPPGSVPARDLARPGSGCTGCSVRHACHAYREVAPRWWRSYPEGAERLPYDTWGKLTEVRRSAQPQALDVVLTDAAGRRVRVDGVGDRHGFTPETSGEVAMFSLMATGPPRGFDGTRYHPRCFHDLPRDAREFRAWSATCFAIDEQETRDAMT